MKHVILAVAVLVTGVSVVEANQQDRFQRRLDKQGDKNCDHMNLGESCTLYVQDPDTKVIMKVIKYMDQTGRVSSKTKGWYVDAQGVAHKEKIIVNAEGVTSGKYKEQTKVGTVTVKNVATFKADKDGNLIKGSANWKELDANGNLVSTLKGKFHDRDSCSKVTHDEAMCAKAFPVVTKVNEKEKISYQDLYKHGLQECLARTHPRDDAGCEAAFPATPADLQVKVKGIDPTSLDTSKIKIADPVVTDKPASGSRNDLNAFINKDAGRRQKYLAKVCDASAPATVTVGDIYGGEEWAKPYASAVYATVNGKISSPAAIGCPVSSSLQARYDSNRASAQSKNIKYFAVDGVQYCTKSGQPLYDKNHQMVPCEQ